MLRILEEILSGLMRIEGKGEFNAAKALPWENLLALGQFC